MFQLQRPRQDFLRLGAVVLRGFNARLCTRNGAVWQPPHALPAPPGRQPVGAFDDMLTHGSHLKSEDWR